MMGLFMTRTTQLSEPYLLILDVVNPAIIQLHKSTKQVVNLLEHLGGMPDGIAIDSIKQLLYWSNMGEEPDADDGSINVINYDGTGRTMLLGNGQVRTPKQLKLELTQQRLYWCDREGGRVSSCKTDGTDIQIHVARPRDNQNKVDILDQCIGVTVDFANNWLYWTQKGNPKGHQERLFRAPLRLTQKINPTNRADIVLLLDKLPEPIDLLLDEKQRILYWTDRGGEPDGNSLNCADITDDGLVNYRVICRGLNEAISLTYDKSAQLMYVSGFNGGVYQVVLTTGEVEKIYQGGGYTGIISFP